MHAAGRARPEHDEHEAMRTPAAAVFSGYKADTLYRWRQLTKRTGVQHGPRFAYDSDGRPYYERGWLLDYRRDQAIATARAARRRT